MEDTHVHLDDVNDKYKFPSDMTRAFYAVYDGHGGVHAADLAQKYLHECVLKSDELKKKGITDDEILATMRGGFTRTDSVIKKKSMEGMWSDGCTAVSIIVMGSKLYIGNLGDAEAVIARKQKDGSLAAELLTFKHKPNDKDERQRIEDAGGHVVFGRVLGSLAVSRALGDAEFKTPRNKAEKDFVSSDPFLKTVQIGPDVPFMILACDGLWDKVTYQAAVDFVANLHKGGGKGSLSPEEAAQMLVKKALDDGTLDNVSVIIVYFTW